MKTSGKIFRISALSAVALILGATPAFASSEIKGETLFQICGLPVTNSILTTWIFTVIIIAAFKLLVGKPKPVPSKGQLIVEDTINALAGIFEPLMGKRAFKAAFPLLLGFFAYILMMNWSGLLPGVGSIGEYVPHAAGTGDAAAETKTLVPFLRPANTDLNTTLALAIISFCAWIYFVMKYAGPKAFLKDTFGNKASRADVGTPIYLSLFVVFFAVGCIDIVSIVMRLLSLSFRLYGNNFGGEVLLANMHELALGLPRWASWLIPLPFYLLELLIGLIQAFLFTLLTAVYIGLLTMHEEEEAE